MTERIHEPWCARRAAVCNCVGAVYGADAAPAADSRDTKVDIVRENAEKDPTYAPYCLRCSTMARMQIVERFYWRCAACGAAHDDRDPSDTEAERFDDALTRYLRQGYLDTMDDPLDEYGKRIVRRLQTLYRASVPEGTND